MTPQRWVAAERDATARWTTSVCTGSLLLGAAGLLKGKRATSHWIVRESLRDFGAEPVGERVVVDGDVVTAAGVSAGIDMALTPAAYEVGALDARALQAVIEYDPQPPYHAGSLANADSRPSGARESSSLGVADALAGGVRQRCRARLSSVDPLPAGRHLIGSEAERCGRGGPRAGAGR